MHRTRHPALPVFAPADQPSPDGKAADGAAPAAAPVQPAPALSQAEIQQRTQLSRRLTASLGEIVSVLIRSPGHKFNTLADLEWMVIPAIATGQFRVAEAVHKDTGNAAPVAVVMWASVSAEVDKRLTENVGQPLRLKPDEWRSGSNVWLIEAIGEPRAVMGLLQRLKQNELKEQTVRMRIKDKDGKVSVGRLELQQAAPAKT